MTETRTKLKSIFVSHSLSIRVGEMKIETRKKLLAISNRFDFRFVARPRRSAKTKEEERATERKREKKRPLNN